MFGARNVSEIAPLALVEQPGAPILDQAGPAEGQAAIVDPPPLKGSAVMFRKRRIRMAAELDVVTREKAIFEDE